MTLFTQRTRKDGRTEMGLGWIEGISSYDREQVIDNILNTVGDEMTEEEYSEARARLIAGNYLHVGTTTYDVLASEE
jgi:hypothetical protein